MPSQHSRTVAKEWLSISKTSKRDTIRGWKEQVEDKIRAAEEEENRLSLEREQIQAEVERLNREVEEQEKAKEEKKVQFVRGLEKQVREKEEED